MSNPGLSTRSSFLPSFWFVQFGYLYFFREVKPRRRINKRLADIDSGAYHTHEVADALKNDLAGLPRFLKRFGTPYHSGGVQWVYSTTHIWYVGTFAAALVLLSLKLSARARLPGRRWLVRN